MVHLHHCMVPLRHPLLPHARHHPSRCRVRDSQWPHTCQPAPACQWPTTTGLQEQHQWWGVYQQAAQRHRHQHQGCVQQHPQHSQPAALPLMLQRSGRPPPLLRQSQSQQQRSPQHRLPLRTSLQRDWHSVLWQAQPGLSLACWLVAAVLHSALPTAWAVLAVLRSCLAASLLAAGCPSTSLAQGWLPAQTAAPALQLMPCW